jgi:hypothetical protein
MAAVLRPALLPSARATQSNKNVEPRLIRSLGGTYRGSVTPRFSSRIAYERSPARSLERDELLELWLDDARIIVMGAPVCGQRAHLSSPQRRMSGAEVRRILGFRAPRDRFRARACGAKLVVGNPAGGAHRGWAKIIENSGEKQQPTPKCVAGWHIWSHQPSEAPLIAPRRPPPTSRATAHVVGRGCELLSRSATPRVRKGQGARYQRSGLCPVGLLLQRVAGCNTLTPDLPVLLLSGRVACSIL